MGINIERWTDQQQYNYECILSLFYRINHYDVIEWNQSMVAYTEVKNIEQRGDMIYIELKEEIKRHSKVE